MEKAGQTWSIIVFKVDVVMSITWNNFVERDYNFVCNAKPTTVYYRATYGASADYYTLPKNVRHQK